MIWSEAAPVKLVVGLNDMPFSAILMAVSGPVKIIVASAVPSPLMNERPAVVLSVSVPFVAVNVILTWFEAASPSATETWLPLPLENTFAVFTTVVCGPGTVFTGPSFTSLTLIVIVFGVGSRSVPPPLSCTWKVKDVYGLPLPLAAGVNFKSPPVILATGIKSPAFTATLLLVNVPRPGNVVILTASRVFGGASLGSVKPKSTAANV